MIKRLISYNTTSKIINLDSLSSIVVKVRFFFSTNFCNVTNFLRPMQQPYRKLKLQKQNLSPYIDDTKRSHHHVCDGRFAFVTNNHKICWVLIATSPPMAFDFSHPPPTHTMPSPPIMQAQIKPSPPNGQAQKLLLFSIMHNSKFTSLIVMNNGI